METGDKKYLRQAIALSIEGMHSNTGGPFGALVVKDGRVIGQGVNRVVKEGDPTAHAEIVAIREACRYLNSFQLQDCTLFASCEPCPMCLGAIYWARLSRLVFACTRADAARVGFDDELIYRELSLPLEQRSLRSENMLRDEGFDAIKQWLEKPDKEVY